MSLRDKVQGWIDKGFDTRSISFMFKEVSNKEPQPNQSIIKRRFTVYRTTKN